MDINSAPRRDSASSLTIPTCGWIPSPFRSCLSNPASEPSSYLSDDDLYYSDPRDIAPPLTLSQKQGKELTTEEQIEILRAQREREDLQQRQMYVQEKERERRERAKMVRFTTDGEREHKSSNVSGRRPGALRKRSTAVRRNMTQLGN